MRQNEKNKITTKTWEKISQNRQILRMNEAETRTNEKKWEKMRKNEKK